ncbi:IS3 family transposase [Patescibacteria group bacterium]|nr:IS3 family transposase [Patescibacteria group bacterium]
MGGQRGRLISREERELAIELINEAVSSGSRIMSACRSIGISTTTFDRWQAGSIIDSRKGSFKSIPQKLTESEEKQIIEICCSNEYKDSNPYKILADLLDKGIYIASESTFYRVLRKNSLVNHRGNSRPTNKRNPPPERKATGPNQVWTWDITYLKSNIRGIFYYAYVIIDIWDRSIVKWAIHDREEDSLAQELFKCALLDNNEPNVFVHSDNGSPMKGVTLMALFYDLGICNSYSRPRVSNDNPFIESFFKTVKYGASYPGKFPNILIAREWFASFVDGYNTSHRHSGINFITPQEMRSGKYISIAKNRNKVMLQAKDKNPCRWSNNVKQLPIRHVVYLNPTADTRITISKKIKVAV